MRRQLIVALVAITVCGAAAQSAGATVLLGDQKVEATSDTNGNGVTQAFGYTAVASGTPGSMVMIRRAGYTMVDALVTSILPDVTRNHSGPGHTIAPTPGWGTDV